jgi:hypothetical protein
MHLDYLFVIFFLYHWIIHKTRNSIDGKCLSIVQV